MDLDALAAAVRSAAPGPLYRRLAALVRARIEAGDVGPGGRLPSERELADHLELSRTTVVAAYRVLREEGLLEGRRGGGTRVHHRAPVGPPVPSSALAAGKAAGPLGGDVVDLSGSVIEGPLPSILVTAARRVAGDLVPADASGYEPLGLPALRRAIAARWSDRGLPTEPGSIVVTTGAQQALSLLFTLFAREGGTVALGTPTYAGAIDAAQAAGARVLSLPTDTGGIRLEPLEAALDAGDVALVYLVDGPQNPTGAVVPEGRRDAVLRACERAGVPVVEDATLADLAPPTRRARRRAATITVGSLDKTCWPGLRIGWLRAPQEVVARLTRLKVVADLGTSGPGQVLATALLPELDAIAAVRRDELDERRAALADLLEQHLPDWSWTIPSAGPFLWARLPDGDARVLAEVAMAHGVAVLPGPRTDPDRGFSDHLRISCTAAPADLAVGVERLVRAWAQHRGTAAGLHALDAVV